MSKDGRVHWDVGIAAGEDDMENEGVKVEPGGILCGNLGLSRWKTNPCSLHTLSYANEGERGFGKEEMQCVLFPDLIYGEYSLYPPACEGV